MSKKKFKIILCGCITALCLLLTSCGSLQISQGSGNQDTDRVNQTTTETTFASTGNIESVDTLEEVPADRVINAVPFYTRLWKTTGGAVTSEAIGMDQAQQVISEKNVETYWDKNTSQNYGTYEEDNSTYQIWLEDAQSIAAKVKLASKYKLAGVAAWKLGFENSGIWQVITDNLQ